MNTKNYVNNLHGTLPCLLCPLTSGVLKMSLLVKLYMNYVMLYMGENFEFEFRKTVKKISLIATHEHKILSINILFVTLLFPLVFYERLVI